MSLINLCFTWDTLAFQYATSSSALARYMQYKNSSLNKKDYTELVFKLESNNRHERARGHYVSITLSPDSVLPNYV